MNFFDKLNNWIRNTESSIVNVISTFAPWLAPLAPAYMTYQHATNPLTLNFPTFIAFPVALVVEILGFSAVSTFMSFWFYNRRNKAETRKAPLILIIIAFGFYLSLILFSNVLLDAFGNDRMTLIIVRALFTLQTVPAALIVAVRTQHRDMLEDIENERREKEKERENVVRSKEKIEDEDIQKGSSDWRKVRPTLSKEDLESLVKLLPNEMQELATRRGVVYKTIENWKIYAKKELGISDTLDNKSIPANMEEEEKEVHIDF